MKNCCCSVLKLGPNIPSLKCEFRSRTSSAWCDWERGETCCRNHLRLMAAIDRAAILARWSSSCCCYCCCCYCCCCCCWRRTFSAKEIEMEEDWRAADWRWPAVYCCCCGCCGLRCWERRREGAASLEPLTSNVGCWGERRWGRCSRRRSVWVRLPFADFVWLREWWKLFLDYYLHQK